MLTLTEDPILEIELGLYQIEEAGIEEEIVIVVVVVSFWLIVERGEVGMKRETETETKTETEM
jgi:hypothetical protein